MWASWKSSEFISEALCIEEITIVSEDLLQEELQLATIQLYIAIIQSSYEFIIQRMRGR